MAMFQVQASRDAEVMLWPMISSYEAEHYVIVIGPDGDRRAIEFRYAKADKIDTVLSRSFEEHILDPHHLHTFWVTWVDNQIRCGIGPFMEELEAFSYDDPHGLMFNGLTMATPKGDDTAHWEIGEIQGMVYEFLLLLLLRLTMRQSSTLLSFLCC